VHAALFLMLAFFTASGLWMLLKAEFLAITLVLVYVGAVMVLFLFVVMMLDINSDELRAGFWKHLPLAGLVGALIALEMAAVLLGGFKVSVAKRDAARAAGDGQLQGAGRRDLHPLPVPLAGGGRAAAGGHHRRHRADPAGAQGQQVPGPVRAAAGEEGGPRAAAEDGCGEAHAFTTTRGELLMGALTLGHFLTLGAMLFALSVIGIFLNRKNLIVLLMAIELMLLAVNLNFVAFSHFLGDMAGQVFVFFILTVAAAESAIGLAILVVLFRNRSTIRVDELDTLKG
jgi:NADH-quinone oxidoreductase subunit K